MITCCSWRKGQGMRQIIANWALWIIPWQFSLGLADITTITLTSSHWVELFLSKKSQTNLVPAINLVFAKCQTSAVWFSPSFRSEIACTPEHWHENRSITSSSSSADNLPEFFDCGWESKNNNSAKIFKINSMGGNSVAINALQSPTPITKVRRSCCCTSSCVHECHRLNNACLVRVKIVSFAPHLISSCLSLSKYLLHNRMLGVKQSVAVRSSSVTPAAIVCSSLKSGSKNPTRTPDVESRFWTSIKTLFRYMRPTFISTSSKGKLNIRKTFRRITSVRVPDRQIDLTILLAITAST